MNLICPRCGLGELPMGQLCEQHAPVTREGLTDVGVVYEPQHGPREDGVIVTVGPELVFVRYAGDVHAKATRPSDLVTSTGGVPLAKWWDA